MFLSEVDVASKNLDPLPYRLKHEKKLLSSGLIKTIFGHFWVTSVGSEAQITYNKTMKFPGELHCLIPFVSFVMTVPAERRRFSSFTHAQLFLSNCCSV